MEMAQVRYFLALCNEKNFTCAARRCGVAQPSLTQAIKKLESEVGGPFFHRSHKATELTKLGHMLKPYFAAIDRLTAKIKHGPKRGASRRRTTVNGFANSLGRASSHVVRSPRKPAVRERHANGSTTMTARNF